MKYSRQRELIYQTVCKHPIHPSAEEVFQLVKKEMPQIGIATVYRNLSALSQQHILRRYRGEDGIDRFDASTHEHPHFQCTVCQTLYDYPTDDYEAVKKLLLGKSGFKETGIDIVVKGVCNRCLDKGTDIKQ